MNDDNPVIVSVSIESDFDHKHLKHYHFDNFNVDVIKKAPYVIVYTDSVEFTMNTLRKIRQFNLPLVYLKPVFSILKNDAHRDYIELIVDRVFDAKEFSKNKIAIDDLADRINNRIQLIPNYASKMDSNLAVKILRFLYSRENQLVPVRNTNSCFGYSYPNIDAFFNKSDKRIFTLLTFFENHALVSYEFVDRIFRCTSCLSAYLSFREICPKCQSANLVTKEMIHHFRCAYVGSMDDFVQGEELICPKCKKNLKLIGNDYEKPSNINICQNCSNRFQSPVVETVCYNCGKINDPDDLIQSVIKKYTLEDLAENVVLHGIDSHFQHVLEGRLDLMKFGIFKKFLNFELKRIIRFKEFVSTLAVFHIRNLDKIYIDLGKKGQRLFRELALLMKEELNDTDMISSYNESMFCILFNNMIPEDANVSLGKLKKSVLELISHNLQYDVDITTSSAVMNGRKDADTLLKELMQDDVD